MSSFNSRGHWHRVARLWSTSTLVWLAAHLPSGVIAAEPPPAWRCLSAVAWQQEQEFQKPTNDEQAFRRGPFDLSVPAISGKIEVGKLMPWPAKGTSPQVQALLAAGLASLHALDDEAAERSFREACLRDANCAAAWLGLAIANEKLPSRAAYFLERATAVAPADSLEARWVTVYQAFFQSQGSKDLPDRLKALASMLETMPAEGDEISPGSVALGLRYRILAAHISGLPMADAVERDAALAKWTQQPGGDLLLPYTVLLWTKTDPQRAASHGQKLVQRFPSPAMQRLAAEPLLALGRISEALPLLEAAATTSAPDFREWVHASNTQSQQQYDRAATLAWTYYHGGMPEKALAVTGVLQHLPRKPGFTGLEAVDDNPDGVYLEALRLRAQLLMATGSWQELSSWMGSLAGTADSLMLKLHANYHAMLAASALGQRENMVKLRTSLKQTTELIQATPYLNRHGLLATRMMRGAEAFDALCQGRVSPFLKEAKEVPVSIVAAKLANAGAKDGAAALLEEALRSQPGSVPLKQLNQELRNGGTLRVVASSGEIPETTPSNGTPAAADTSLAQGTTAPIAPPLSLPDKLGALHDLQAQRGKPVLVIFFLGGGCPHCVEQLQKFRPQVPAFNQAGIEVITVSTDKVEELELTLGKDPAIDPNLPFLILADPGLATFKAWRCHDDFLNKPLHGTFLLDGDGRVLWSDVSHDPYVQAVYLLGESKRLLGLAP